MKVFVDLKVNIVFIECDSENTVKELKDKILSSLNLGRDNAKSSEGLLSSIVKVGDLYYCGKKMELEKKLKEFNINHTGYVLKWENV